MDLPLRVNKSLRASFTLVQLLVRSYIRTTKRSSSGVAFCKATSVGFSLSCLNTSVISLKLHHVSHAVFFPLLANADVWSHPVKA